MLRTLFLSVSFFFSVHIHAEFNENRSNPEYANTNKEWTPCTLTVVAIADDDELCAGETTVISAIPDDGVDPISYIWSPGGQTSQDITVSPTSTTTYAVTATDDQGCMAEHEVTVIVNPMPVLDLNASSNTICEGTSTTITASSSTGTPPFTYLWDQGLSAGSSQTVSPNTTTTYNVTVVDISSCEDISAITINVIPSPIVSASADPTIICNGSMSTLGATANGGSPGYSFVWDQGLGSGASHTVSPTATTIYTVTVTDDNDCTDEASVQVQVEDSPSPVITGDASICEGESTTLSAGNFTTYLWSTNAITQSITVQNSGTYGLTVTNATGCSGSAEFTVTVNDNPDVTANASPSMICAGESSTLTSFANGGSSPYSYFWDNGLGDGEIHDVNPTMTTTYMVTATDDNGCTDESAITVVVNPNPVLTLDADPNTICEGSISNLSATANGGTAPFVFNWDQGLGSGANQSVSPNITTTYTAVLFDFNGCEDEKSITVNVNSSPLPSITGNTILCEGDVSELTASAGFASYLWNTNENTPSIFVEDEGIYSVTVTDNNGCEGETSVEVFVNEGLEPQITGSTEICEGESTTLDAGPGFSTYLWSNGDMTQTTSVNNSGNFTVSVTNDTGCEGEANVSVVVHPNPIGQANSNSPICVGEQILFNADGGTGYLWSGPQGFGSNVQDPMILDAQIGDSGIYSVTIVDDNGCSDVEVLDVIVNALPNGSISANSKYCEGEPIELNASGGNDYSWSGPSNFTSQDQNPIIPNANGTNSGVYIVTITNAENCTQVLSTEIEVLQNPTPVISGNTTICQGASATLQVVGNYATYLWSTGAMDKNITVDVAGNYEVTVTNDDGCSGTAVVSVMVANALSPMIFGDTVLCNESSGILDAGASFDHYIWNTGDTTQTININNPGIYAVSVSTNNGCQGTDTLEVIKSEILFESIISHELCYDSCDASIMISSDPNYQFQWSNGMNTNNIFNLCSGNYIVTITDELQCTFVQEFIVDAGYSFEVEIGIMENEATAMPNGGVGPYTFLWNTGETTESIHVSGNQIYTVTVIDNNGCGAMSSIHFTSNGSSLSPKLPKLFPNPTNDYLNIDYQDIKNIVKNISIIDLQAKQKLFFDFSIQNIDIRPLEPGIYFVRIRTTKGCIDQRLIVLEQN